MFEAARKPAAARAPLRSLNVDMADGLAPLKISSSRAPEMRVMDVPDSKPAVMEVIDSKAAAVREEPRDTLTATHR